MSEQAKATQAAGGSAPGLAVVRGFNDALTRGDVPGMLEAAVWARAVRLWPKSQGIPGARGDWEVTVGPSCGHFSLQTSMICAPR
jgi:hypothetical protein